MYANCKLDITKNDNPYDSEGCYAKGNVNRFPKVRILRKETIFNSYTYSHGLVIQNTMK